MPENGDVPPAGCAARSAGRRGFEGGEASPSPDPNVHTLGTVSSAAVIPSSIPTWQTGIQGTIETVCGPQRITVCSLPAVVQRPVAAAWPAPARTGRRADQNNRVYPTCTLTSRKANA